MCTCTPTLPNATLASFTLILTKLAAMEAAVGAIDDALAMLTAKDEALAAAVTDLVADVRALIDQLRNAPLTPEQQAAVDALSAKLDATAGEVATLDTEVGDADGSDTPPA